MKSKKQALAKSVLALLLCVAMLVGTTFAWFTDSVQTGINEISAGNLDVELYHSNATVNNQKVTANTKLFNVDLWEPGVATYENLTIANEGDLALIYQLAINSANENYVVDGAAQYGLSSALKVGFVDGGVTASDRDGVIASVTEWTTLSAFLSSGSLQADGKETVGIVIYWQPGDNDNLWNLNNGKTLNTGDVLSIDLGVKVTATQEQYEYDSFGKDYDDVKGSVIVPTDANNRTTEEVVITAGNVTVTVPAGVLLNNGTNKLKLSITEMDNSQANVELETNDSIRSLDVHIDGVSANNDVAIAIHMPEAVPAGLNMGNYALYHVEKNGTNEMDLIAADAEGAHNQFKYDPINGDVTLYMATFSEVAMVANSVAAWQGNANFSWYDASATELTIANADQLWAFSQIVGGMAAGYDRDSFEGKTVTLVNDINLADGEEDGKIFYPIGYYNSTGSYNKVSGGSVTSSVYSFQGTFDGNGHTIANFYQNTWEMFGDYNDGYSGTPNHYKDAMGLFGYVHSGTIKNLTVANFSSDGEFTPTGSVAAYACNSTFENIAISNCNPRVYNTGNGGIVGIGGNNDDPDSYKLTFNNITIDNTNKITALWGSWDVACGGLIGMFRGAGHAYMTNCHVGAQIDVYNDVCGNYQYYWYRYAGSLIGTNKNMTTDANGYTVPETHKFHATNCTVHFGDWNDYYYCELVANSLASYTHDHQMSRLTEIASLSEIQDANGNWTKTGNYILFGNGGKQKQSGEGTCYHIVNKNGTLVEHKHTDSGEETVDGATVLKEDKQRLYLPFNQLFTGYGWGVKHVPVGEFPGVTILGRPAANSVDKWAGKVNALYTNKEYTMAELFSATGADVEILNASTIVSVSNVAGSNVEYTVTNNYSDWTKSTVKFVGQGTVYVTIQDYYFCNPTSIKVQVSNPAAPVIDDNLIKNGTFENGFANWEKGWATAVDRDYAAYTGNKGVYLAVDKNSTGFMWQNNIPVKDGRTYTISFRYKAVSGGVNWKLTGVSTSTKYASGYVNSGEWTKVTKDFTVNGDTAVNVMFLGSGAYNDKIYVDDIVLVEKPIVANGHFEFGEESWKFNSGSHTLTSDAHSGNYAVQISNPGAWGEAALQTVDVKANTAYKITFWTKRVSGTGTFTLLTAQHVSPWANFTKISGSNSIKDTSGQWVQNTYIVNSGSYTKMMVKLTSSAANSGSIIIDDIVVTEIDYDGYVLNGNFETGVADGWSAGTVSTDAAYEGNYGLKVLGGGGWGGITYYDFSGLDTTKEYTLTMRVKVNAGGIVLEMMNNPWNNTVKWSTYYTQAANNGTWQEIKLVFKPTTSGAFINICGNGGSTPADFYIDNVSITAN